jgi:hypothetical protein
VQNESKVQPQDEVNVLHHASTNHLIGKLSHRGEVAIGVGETTLHMNVFTGQQNVMPVARGATLPECAGASQEGRGLVGMMSRLMS